MCVCDVQLVVRLAESGRVYICFSLAESHERSSLQRPKPLTLQVSRDSLKEI